MKINFHNVADNVDEIKAKIHRQYGVSIDEQSLFIDSKCENAFMDANVPNCSIVFLKFRTLITMEIFVKTLTGKTITLLVNPGKNFIVFVIIRNNKSQ